MASARGARCVVAALACLLCRCFLLPASSFVQCPLVSSDLVARQPGASTGVFGTPALAVPTSGDTLAAGAAALAGAVLAARLVAARARQSCVPCAAAKKKGGKGGGKKGRGGGAPAPAAGDDGEDLPEVDVQALVNEWQATVEKPKASLRDNLVGIRAGRASPALLEGLQVEAYGSTCGIKEVGTVTATDQTTLTVVCYDGDIAPAVEKAIRVSDLGYSVVTNGATLRIGIPEMTQDKRMKYIKMAKDATDNSKQALRNLRQGIMKKVKNLKQLSKDDSYSLSQTVENMVKTEVGELDSMFKKKEKELLTL